MTNSQANPTGVTGSNNTASAHATSDAEDDFLEEIYIPTSFDDDA